MIINCSALVGSGFKYVDDAVLEVDGENIVAVREGHEPDAIDARGFVVMPGLVNAHTHVGDSFAKEAALGMGVESAVGPDGIKWRMYKEAPSDEIERGMRNTIDYMLNSGITAFADFREGGDDGAKMLMNACKGLPIKKVVLGRDIKELSVDGYGLNQDSLNQVPEDRNERIIAVHAGEVEGDVDSALEKNPDVLVHFVKITDKHIDYAKDIGASIVVCPRSNAALGVGFPMIRRMLDTGLCVGLGTDNVMINSPNMWREMEFVVKVSMMSGGISPIDVLRMATENGAEIFGLNSGVIAAGRCADLIFISKAALNLRYNKDMVATIINRCEPENVRKVMIDGAFVIDKDEVGKGG